jgi:hypothetical protein
MKALFSLLFIWITVNAQSREELHKRYGLPISETFTVRPGVFLTTSYAKNGELCEMIIHAEPLTSDLNYPITKTMESKALKKLIDDLVPMSQRGNFSTTAFLNIDCPPLNNCFGVEDDYERVTIIRNGSTDKERYAIIHWKAAACRR